MLIYDKIIMPRGKLRKRYGPPKEYILTLKILAERDQDLADARILLPPGHRVLVSNTPISSLDYFAY